MTSESENRDYSALRDIVARLRAPDGCPWDREQTHTSLRPFLIEEAYEVIAALDAGDAAAMPEELGDLLFQILLHTQMAEEAGDFTMTDVLTGLKDKLVRRHPHVFGDKQLSSAAAVVEQWDELKRDEREPQQSALAGVPGAMPALAYAQTLTSRAEKAGFAWPARGDVLAKINEELEEMLRATSKAEKQAEFGDLLFNVANYARYLEIDAEEALREAGHKFRRRFEGVEQRALAASQELSQLSDQELLALWQKVKADETAIS